MSTNTGEFLAEIESGTRVGTLVTEKIVANRCGLCG